MRKLILLLLLFTVGSLCVGIPNLWNYFRYREPVPVIYRQMIAPDLPTYVRLQKIQLHGDEALWSNDRQGSKIYVPIHAADEQAADQVRLILESDDPELLTAVVRIAGKHRLEQELTVLGVFARKTEVTGMVHPSFVDPELNASLHKLAPLLTENYSVLQEGDSPSLGLGVLGTILGATFLALLNWIRTRPSRIPEPPLLAKKN